MATATATAPALAAGAAAALAFYLCLNVGLCRTIAPQVAAATKNSTKVVLLQLIPRDSPLAATSTTSEASFLRGLTESDRLLRAIRRSHARASAVERRVRALFSANPEGYETPVSDSEGAFLLKMTLGSSSLQYHAILDTGSDLIWTQCHPCVECYDQPTPIFDPSNSTTYNPCTFDSAACRLLPDGQSWSDINDQCMYRYQYSGGSGSTEGTLATETFTFSGAPFPGLIFGCGHNNNGTDFGDSAGVVGFGRGALSLPSQFASAVGSTGATFAYCLTNATGGSSPLWLGPDAGSTFPSNGSTTATISLILNHVGAADFYYVSLTGIDVEGTAVEIPSGTLDIQPDGSGGVIIDSGSTVSYLETRTYNNLIAALKSAISLDTVNGSAADLELCYDGSTAASADNPFPTVTLTFDDQVKWRWDPSNYMFVVKNMTCAALAPSADVSLIGSIAQLNYFILHDTSENKLSFAPTQCDSLKT